jgi:hypothetical protein
VSQEFILEKIQRVQKIKFCSSGGISMPRIQNRLSYKPATPVLKGTIHPASQDYQLTLDLFIRDRKLINIRPSTIRWYTNQLKQFKKYLSDRNLQVLQENSLRT